MSRTWQPGDVAVVEWYGSDPSRFFRVGANEFCTGHGHPNRDHWHSPRGTYAERLEAAESHHPLAVIDPEDRKQVGRLVRLFWENGTDDCDDPVAMQAAFREFADPKPACATCLDKALAGFTCNTCGNGAES